MATEIKKKIRAFIGEENIEFLTHTRNYLSGTIIQNLLLAAALPLFTYLLSPAEYGIVSIFLTVVSLLVVVFGLNINSGIIRYYLDKKGDFDKALGSNLIFFAAFSIVPISLVLLFRQPLAHFCRLDEDIFIMASVVALVSVSIEIFMAYLNASQQSRKYALINILKTSGMLTISIGLMLWLPKDRHIGRILGELIVMVLLSTYATAALYKLSTLNFNTSYIKYTLRFSVPLIPHAMSRFILGYFDRIIIFQLTTSTATGLYSFAYDVGMFMNLIVLSTVRAWRPIFFEEYREGNIQKISRMVKDYALNVYLIALGIILFAQDAVYLLADKQFYKSIELIPVVVLGYVFVFLYTLYFQYAAFKKRTELISLSTFVAGFANIILNYWLIPIYGYQAAAYTTFLSFGLLFLMHYLNARFILKAQVIPLSKVMPDFILLLFITGLYMFLNTTVLSYWLFLPVRIALMALGIIYYVSAKNKIINREKNN